MKKLYKKLYHYFTRIKYRNFSENKNLEGVYTAHQPVVCNGVGRLKFGENVHIGVIKAPYFLNSYAYIEARNKDATISFGNNVHINNAFSAVAENKIVIGNDVLIGFNCQIIDSNFHDLDPNKRHETDPNPEPILIRENVFIGNNVTILKGVVIGKNSVIASGAIVTKSIPDNVIAGGVPAKVLRDV